MSAIITLSLLAILVLYLGLFKANKSLLPVSIIGLLAAAGFSVYQWNSELVPLFSGMVLFDNFSVAFSVLMIALTVLILLLSRDYFKAEGDQVAEYFSLILFSLTGALIVVEDFNFDNPNTKEYRNILSNLKVQGKSLLLTADHNQNVYLSGRNLQKSAIHAVRNANTYDIVNADVLILSENSVNQLKSGHEQP